MTLALTCAGAFAADSNGFSTRLEGKSPAVVGRRVAENCQTRRFRDETNPNQVREGVIDPELINLATRFEMYRTEPGSKRVNPAAHVDDFVLGMVPGLKNAWLDVASCGQVARKARLALVDRLDENAKLKDVCVGTNKEFDKVFLAPRLRMAGDLHDQAAMLWTASALFR